MFHSSLLSTVALSSWKKAASWSSAQSGMVVSFPLAFFGFGTCRSFFINQARFFPHLVSSSGACPSLWRREFQNKNGANSKTTEYAANIQKADLEEALPGPLSYVLSSIPSLCAAALAIVMCASIPTASKPSSAAAASVVPLPANGSRILPPGTHICTT